MAVKGPVPRRIGGKNEAHALTGLYIDRVLHRQAIALTVLHGKEEPVKMHRVLHHRVVNQHEAYALAELHTHWPSFGEFLPVEAPGETLHIAGEMELDLALHRRGVAGGQKIFELRIGEDATPVAIQPVAGFRQAILR